MPILLMNLLIGLAVGDIESVRRNAQLKRLAMQVVLHTELERKLPQIWLERVDKMELIEYPNNQKCKLGIFDIVLRKWFCNPFNDDSKCNAKFDLYFQNFTSFHVLSANLDMSFDSNEEVMASEMEKQRKKLRDISYILDQQHQLLRLIIQVRMIISSIRLSCVRFFRIDTYVFLTALTENGNKIRSRRGRWRRFAQWIASTFIQSLHNVSGIALDVATHTKEIETLKKLQQRLI